MADPEGVRGIQTNPLLSLNYFIFMGNVRKNGSNYTNRTPSANLYPLSKNPGSTPETSAQIEPPQGVRGIQTNPLLSLNYFIFMGNVRKNGSNYTNRTPSANLYPLSKNPGSTPETSGCTDS